MKPRETECNTSFKLVGMKYVKDIIAFEQGNTIEAKRSTGKIILRTK
jgi:hypothetical protein